jgi:hypothetical protein
MAASLQTLAAAHQQGAAGEQGEGGEQEDGVEHDGSPGEDQTVMLTIAPKRVKGPYGVEKGSLWRLYGPEGSDIDAQAFVMHSRAERFRWCDHPLWDAMAQR